MLSEGPLGSEITPLNSLLGALWHHLGANLVPFGSKMAPPEGLWVPQLTAKAHQSRPLWHKSSPEGPQGRPGCPPAPHSDTRYAREAVDPVSFQWFRALWLRTLFYCGSFVWMVRAKRAPTPPTPTGRGTGHGGTGVGSGFGDGSVGRPQRNRRGGPFGSLSDTFWSLVGDPPHGKNHVSWVAAGTSPQGCGANV